MTGTTFEKAPKAEPDMPDARSADWLRVVPKRPRLPASLFLREARRASHVAFEFRDLLLQELQPSVLGVRHLGSLAVLL